jgi:hypothetical protein
MSTVRPFGRAAFRWRRPRGEPRPSRRCRSRTPARAAGRRGRSRRSPWRRRIRSSAVSLESQCAAQCSAVVPSRCEAFRSIRSRTSARAQPRDRAARRPRRAGGRWRRRQIRPSLSTAEEISLKIEIELPQRSQSAQNSQSLFWGHLRFLRARGFRRFQSRTLDARQVINPSGAVADVSAGMPRWSRSVMNRFVMGI